MKTTVEIPDNLFRQAKAAAASRGITLRGFLEHALREKLARPTKARLTGWPVPPPRIPRAEWHRIKAAMDSEFARIDPKDWS